MGGVSFESPLEIAYRVCLWSQLTSRLLLRLTEFEIDTEQDLYQAVKEFAWEEHFDENAYIAIDFNGVNRSIRNTQFGAVRVKDGIVDRFFERCNKRPSVDKQNPDIRINVHLKRTHVTVSLDFSGIALHMRGYRLESGDAPLKENLAAAIIDRSAWLGEPMLDPMCGSGTLLIEAAYRKLKLPVGLFRARFGFEDWLGHQSEMWRSIRDEAKQSYQAKNDVQGPIFYGYDCDAKVLDKAQRNIERAGLSHLIQLEKRDVADMVPPCEGPGYILSNPPYGARLGEVPGLLLMHLQLGQHLKQQFSGWGVSLFSGSPELLNMLRLRAEKSYRFMNGPLECELKNYRIAPEAAEKEVQPVAPDFANRLKKNIKGLQKWLKQEQQQCYRLYDADLPEYNAAVDRYGTGW